MSTCVAARQCGYILYFDDRTWAIRYLMADTRRWFKGRQVLMSPSALTAAIKEGRSITIGLSQQQIEDSPLLPNDMPVLRQIEEAPYGYYGWPPYWNATHLRGPHPNPLRKPDKWLESAPGPESYDLHLRRAGDVYNCHIQTEHGEIGIINDLIIEDETWTIRFLVIDTQKWWPGKTILVPPEWIRLINWVDSNIVVNLPNDIPEYHEDRHPQYTH